MSSKSGNKFLRTCIVSVRRYRKSHLKNNVDDSCRATPQSFLPEDTETQFAWVDGTCMLISRETLKTGGFLNPSFRAPGWGSDVDYCHRASESGLELYVSHRAIRWHHRGIGGLSATRVYGNRSQWIAKGLQQAKEDLRAKYGPHWRDVLPLPLPARSATNTAGTRRSGRQHDRRTHIRCLERAHRPW